MSRAPALSVVLPCYDVEGFVHERIEVLSRYLSENVASFEIVPVDDRSRDSTASVLEGLASDTVRPVFLERNGGKFAALRAGMALTRGEACLFTDADVPYDLDVVPKMLELVTTKGFHLAVGDRTLGTSNYTKDLNLVRRVTHHTFALGVRLLFTSEHYDTQCGIKAYRGDVARALFPLGVEDGFAGDAELIYIALKHNLAIRRVPVRLIHHEPSSVRPLRDAPGMAWSIAQLPIRYRRGLYDSARLHRLGRGAES